MRPTEDPNPIGQHANYTKRGFLVTANSFRDGLRIGPARDGSKILIRSPFVLAPVDLHFDLSHWPVQNWRSPEGQKNYIFTETGSALFERAVRKIFHRAKRMVKMSDQFGRPVLLPYPIGFYQAILLHYRILWKAEERVENEYAKMKSDYLSPDSMKFLNVITTRSHPFGDTLVLLDLPAGTDISKLTDKQFYNALAMTIRISYGWRGVGANSLDAVSFRNGRQLPFMWRIPGVPLVNSEHARIRDYYIERFENKKVAELTRYARFEEMPRAIRAKLLLEALLRARNHGVKTIIVSVDDGTRQLFARYNFVDFAEFHSGQDIRPEFLMSLDVDSEDFARTIVTLADEAADVIVSREH